MTSPVSVRPDKIFAKKGRRRGRVVRLREIRCEHFGQVEFRGRGYGFEMYLCSKCFSSLVTLLNSMMRQMTPKQPRDVAIGFFCERCEERKYDGKGLVVIHEVDFQKEYRVSEGKRVPYFKPTGKLKQKTYCKACWRMMDERRGIVLATSKNIFIPNEVDDRVVQGLFGDRLEKTRKVFTLIPTDYLTSIMKYLPDDVKQKVADDMRAMSVSQDAVLEGMPSMALQSLVDDTEKESEVKTRKK